MNWMVLRSKPNQEKILEQEVLQRGIKVYYPQICVKPVNPRSRRTRPFLPSYLFVQADPQRVGFHELNWIPFSQGLLSFGGVVSEVPDAIVQEIRRKLDLINAAGGEQLHGLRRGEACRITHGPFEGYEAIFDMTLPGQERVRLLIELASRQQVPMTVPAGYVGRV